jgi:ABC-type Fe3+ transport system substrate-binding protein
VALPISDETLLIPNTVAVVRDAPHPAAAQRLFEYLQRPEIEAQLISANALEGTSTAGARLPTLKVDWGGLLRDLEFTTARLNAIFLR